MVPNLNFATGKSKVQTLRANGFHQSRGSDRGLLRPSWPLSHQRGLHLLQAEVHAIERLRPPDRDARHHPLVTTMVSQRRQQRSLTENTLNSCSRWVSILISEKSWSGMGDLESGSRGRTGLWEFSYSKRINRKKINATY